MANDLQTGSETSVTSLVTGILNDAQELIKQQLALFKREVQEDIRKTKEAASSLALGVGTSVAGGSLLCFMIVHLLHWAWPDQLPLWGCFGIVGGVLTVTGCALAYAGKKKFESFNPLPDESAQAMKENVQWLTNRK
jgi:hypothetical protein